MSLGTLMLVPGFMGSRLATSFDRSFFVRDRTVWLNYPLLAGEGFNFLKLDASGQHSANPVAGDLLPSAPLRPYYDGIYQYASSAGWNLFECLLDWRLPPQFDAATVASNVRSLRSQAPVNIVCHSRGGLVVRLALDMLRQSGDLGLVGRVAGFGIPHQGTLDAAFLLAGWSRPYSYLVGLISRLVGSSIFGQGSEFVRNIVTTWPGLYALMPSVLAPWISQPSRNALYNYLTWQEAGVPVNSSWLASAVGFWGTLPAIPPSIPWLDVFSSTFVAATDFTGGLPPTGPGTVIDGASGDGSVPVQSATVPGNLSVQTPASHVGLIRDARVYPLLTQWFFGGLNQSVVISGPIVP